MLIGNSGVALRLRGSCTLVQLPCAGGGKGIFHLTKQLPCAGGGKGRPRFTSTPGEGRSPFEP